MFASSPDEWHHWAFTYETSTGADNGMLTVYQDGSPVFTHSNGRALFPPPEIFNEVALLGTGQPGELSRGFVGSIALFRIHDNVLTPSEVTTSFLTTGPGLRDPGTRNAGPLRPQHRGSWHSPATTIITQTIESGTRWGTVRAGCFFRS
jgi:hypothetical protein